MSRIGKKPIPLPKGVTVQVADGAVEVKGPKGQLRQPLPPGIVFELADGQLHGEDGARGQGARQVPRPRRARWSPTPCSA